MWRGRTSSFRRGDGGCCSHLEQQFECWLTAWTETTSHVSIPSCHYSDPDIKPVLHVRAAHSDRALLSAVKDVCGIPSPNIHCCFVFPSVCQRRASETFCWPAPCLTSTTSPTWATSSAVCSALTSSLGSNCRLSFVHVGDVNMVMNVGKKHGVLQHFCFIYQKKTYMDVHFFRLFLTNMLYLISLSSSLYSHCF